MSQTDSGPLSSIGKHWFRAKLCVRAYADFMLLGQIQLLQLPLDVFLLNLSYGMHSSMFVDGHP
jgi:hypothetical protein